ncbi:MAG: hypothetical protein KBG15_24400 [Kofleriaceae bacterium]|nr:hypothetical protein [Kofleriaceae bacterium]
MYNQRLNKKYWLGLAFAATHLTGAAVAFAQAWVPPNIPQPQPTGSTTAPPAPTPTMPAPPQPATTSADSVPTVPGNADSASEPMPVDSTVPTDPYRFSRAPAKKRFNIDLPEVITTPTGYLLPAGILYSKSSLDTGGGAASDLRLGLGDVAEFGLATTDQVRRRLDADDVAERIQPYVTASFRMGVGENRLFHHQPAMTLGYRKSFEREYEDHATRVAELTLVASKHIGARTTVHAGAAFWDAQIRSLSDDTNTFVLHDKGLAKQLRGFGGIGVKATDQADVLIDWGWTPEFCYTCTDQVRLRAVLSWGVRYNIADWVRIESGVRVADIQNANLLDAQIFGQVSFVSRRIRDAIESLRE